jgi:type III secretory pathway component EscR
MAAAGRAERAGGLPLLGGALRETMGRQRLPTGLAMAGCAVALIVTVFGVAALLTG